MSLFNTFFSYSSEENIENHVILNRYRPIWLLLNNTAFEIARSLDMGESIDDAAVKLVEKYEISKKLAIEHVKDVLTQLKQQHFIHSKQKQTAQRLPSLKSIYFHLTTRCNLSCSHCYIAPYYKNAKDLPISIVNNLIDELAKIKDGEVILSGGEALLHPDIKKIIEYAASKVHIKLLTNGTLINKEWAAFLYNHDVSVQISIDGSRSSIHDAVRGKGSFDKALKAVEYLQNAGLKSKLNFCTVIMKQNVHDLEHIILLAQTLDIPFVRFLPLRRIGRARDKWDSLSGMGVQEYTQFFQYISKLLKNKSTKVDITCGLSGLLLYMPEKYSDEIWCPIGNTLVVGTDGNTYPCVLMMNDEFKLGNVFSQSVNQIMESDKMKNICMSLSDRRNKIARCTSCRWQNFCQGGCMGQALDHKGTIWDTDDFCDYRKKAYENAFNTILK